MRTAFHLAFSQGFDGAVKPCGPERVEAGKPCFEREEGFGVEGVEAALTLGPDFDHAGPVQEGEVARDAGLGNACGLGDDGDRGLAAFEGGDDVKACGVGQQGDEAYM